MQQLVPKAIGVERLSGEQLARQLLQQGLGVFNVHVGRDLPDEATLMAAGRELLAELSADGVLVTRGEQGMMLFSRHGTVPAIPVSDRSEVYDVSGAGDTCVATVILALAAGIEAPEAARLSNVASGIAVRKLGTSTVSVRELAEAVEKQHPEYPSK